MFQLKSAKRQPIPKFINNGCGMEKIVKEPDFLHMLSFERKRAERTRRPLLLMLVNLCGPVTWDGDLLRVLAAIEATKRETDIVGWYDSGSKLGVIFNEVSHPAHSIVPIIRERVTNALATGVGQNMLSQVSLSFHVFAESGTHSNSSHPSGNVDLVFYPDLKQQHGYNSTLLKRTLDVAIGGMLLLIALPLLVGIAVAVKLTSRGPVLFRQERVGQYGRTFTFLKFRSMYVNNDPKIHEQYVSNLIRGAPPVQDDNGKPVFKIVGDPRVTPLGRLLRKSSLDELPQLINVLRGEMSLVGPRPPLNYEFNLYSSWHRRRVIEAKPGITGLWQVSGRSKLNFNDMVRLDLAYVEHSSIWMDLEIIFKTPRAVFSAEGAY